MKVKELLLVVLLTAQQLLQTQQQRKKVFFNRSSHRSFADLVADLCYFFWQEIQINITC